jgi:hypothetical protein
MNQGINEFDATTLPIFETLLYWSSKVRCGHWVWATDAGALCWEAGGGGGGGGRSVAVFNQHVGIDSTIKWRWQVICLKIITMRAHACSKTRELLTSTA